MSPRYHYELIPARTLEEWGALHALRRAELCMREKKRVTYNTSHPEDYSQDHFPLVLKLNGKCIGTGRLDLLKNGGGAIRLVAISLALQQQGHGRMLGQKLEEFAHCKGMPRLYVNANPVTVGYYEKLGFVHEPWDDPAYSYAGLVKGCVPMMKVI